MQIELSVYLPPREKRRVDGLLAILFPLESRSFIARMCARGLIEVNGAVIKKSLDVKTWDVVAVNFIHEKSHLEGENIPVDIVFENDAFAVVNKDAGIAVHPVPWEGGNSGTLVNALLNHFGSLSVINGIERPGLIHRLDKDTSGLILIAKNDQAMRGIQKVISDRKIQKTYLALVCGKVNEGGIIESFMGRDPNNRKFMTNVDEASGKFAKSVFRVREYFPVTDTTLVEVDIHTGRMHQIRVHMKSVGHPVVGDKIYGFEKVNSRFEREFSLGRQWLHAWRLRFRWNDTDWSFEAPIKEDLKKAIWM